MNKITNQTYQETYYEETMPNGLKVVLWHKPEFTSTSCLFGTPYGSLDAQQVDSQGQHISFPCGIAHFLEHKLFESDHGDAMNDFSTMGANVNAFTSYSETCYYFLTASQEIEKPLNLLLDFVQELSITDASVEKEKGIIIQELSMYLQMPDSRLLWETLKSMYQNHPLKNDIGGDATTVSSITKKQLEQCYTINYHPSRMGLFIVTPVDPEKVFQIVRDNQAKKTFLPAMPVTRFFEKEPLEVARTSFEIPMAVSQDKACIGFKLPVEAINDHDRVCKDWALHLVLDAYFSSVNPDYQKWMNANQITPMFNVSEDIGKDYGMILFLDEVQDAKAFQQFVLEQLSICLKTQIKDDVLTQLKHREMGENLRMFNRPAELGLSDFRDRMNGVSLYENFRILEEMTSSDCYKWTKDIDVSHHSITILKKE